MWEPLTVPCFGSGRGPGVMRTDVHHGDVQIHILTGFPGETPTGSSGGAG